MQPKDFFMKTLHLITTFSLDFPSGTANITEITLQIITITFVFILALMWPLLNWYFVHLNLLYKDEQKTEVFDRAG